ncbi:NAD(P)/FAD-dependent oxidoreductase [Streptantibioticus cattleyicolor]|uniref:Ferredoxin reductase n=1 Tax=Streptantibioticus cattleyicolor (strain ATCC 35852 / DSM 46488 / JCM 4925 / NBRC 14057 / NRRL 8057) TaxID=1003195 RepID=F8JIV8_STREN|nr:FAD-dependent oxidoreductase [Streptantibioticus cattleyicolor]AEW98957.1 ferredoxin reductase [Streptantibioticus cattleyicolor NRRL 8057 = DSM 46488]CCB71997.1 NAD(FAD)-dependent dehydrogenase [Streptantibioticus cattleyicolor NRRL 8057 = DSM 46488]
MAGDDAVRALRRDGRIVIVGASLAGLRAAEQLRDEGFTGSLTVIGDEPYEPYDRPPLSKQVLLGRVRPEDTGLPRRRPVDAHWRLGVAATGLDLDGKRVLLADGDAVEFDRLLIATGVRSRPWPHETEAALDGVHVLRTRDDAARLTRRLAGRPRRVLVIGAGFTGSEIASACRERGVAVTVAERGAAPLVGALGGVVGAVAADLQRDHGVDLRCGIMVTALEGDPAGRLRRAHLSDGTVLDVDVAVVALGAVRNTAWLAGSGLAAGPRGIACDAGCRAFDVHGIVTDDVFAAGDVARTPHPLFGYQFISLEHWGNAVEQAAIAAHNMVSPGPERRPHLWMPAFWSSQFGVNIKSVGVPSMADELLVTQGSLAERRFVAAYGYRGRVIAAVGFDHAKWMGFYAKLIEEAAPFPPEFPAVDRRPEGLRPVPAGFPDPALPTHGASVTLTGHSPSERRVVFTPSRA